MGLNGFSIDKVKSIELSIKAIIYLIYYKGSLTLAALFKNTGANWNSIASLTKYVEGSNKLDGRDMLFIPFPVNIANPNFFSIYERTFLCFEIIALFINSKPILGSTL